MGKVGVEQFAVDRELERGGGSRGGVGLDRQKSQSLIAGLAGDIENLEEQAIGDYGDGCVGHSGQSTKWGCGNRLELLEADILC